MPQNDTRTSTPASAAPSVDNVNRTTAASATPPRFESVSSVINNPAQSTSKESEKDGAAQVTTDQVNTSAGQQKAPEEKPGKKGPLNIEELQEKRRMGLLTIDEAKQLNDAENPQTEATVSQKTDDDRAFKDPDKNSFQEKDVIAYMYEKWLIDGVMWVDQKVRKYGAYGFERMLSAVQQGRAESKAEKQRILNSSTFKTSEKITAKQKENEERIKEQSKQKADDIFRVSQVIQAGTLFDPENKELLAKFDEINKSNTPEGQERRQHLEAAAQKLKENPESEEQRQEMKRDATLFARDANINNRFDTECQLTANQITAANMLDTITRDKNAFPNGIESAYDSQIEANTAAVTEATKENREKALQTIDDVDRKSAAAMKAGMYGAQTAHALNTQWENEAFGNFEEMQKHAQKAIDKSIDNTTSGHVDEFGKEPKENEHLTKLNNLVVGKLPEDYAPSERTGEAPREPGHDYTKQGVREAVAAPAPQTTEMATTGLNGQKDKQGTLCDTAQTQREGDAKIAEARTAVSNKGADLAARQNEHDARGQRLMSSPLYARLHNKQQAEVQQAIQQGKETGFKGWKLDVAALKQQKGTYE